MAIDMHAHFTPRGLLQKHKAGRDWYGWRILNDGQGREFVALGEHVLATSASAATGSLDDPSARIASRSPEGIDFEALMITATFWNQHLDEGDAARFCREVNDELAEVQSAHPDQYAGMAVLPIQHTAAALRELDRAVGQLGLRVVSIGSNVRGLNLDEPSVRPVLDAIGESGAALCVHPTAWNKIGEERLPRYHFANSFGAPLESSLAMMSLIYGGFLDRFPGTRLIITQGGGLIPIGVGRFDLRYGQRPEARPMARPPSAYFPEIFVDCLVHDELALELLVKRSGADRIVIGTDFPFRGDIIGGAVRWIEDNDSLSEQQKTRILVDNAAKFLDLPPRNHKSRSLAFP